MPLETWAAFAAASAVLLIILGPTILLVVSYALGEQAIGIFNESDGVLLIGAGIATVAVSGIHFLRMSKKIALHWPNIC